MAKGPTATDTSRHFEQAASDTSRQFEQAANYGMDWFRQLAEQGLEQSKVVLDGFMTAARSSADSIDQQASDIRERSLAMAAQTVTNSFDFAHRLLRAREPQDVLQLQSEFISRQAQTVADQAKELGQTIARDAEDLGRNVGQMHATAETMRRKAAES